MSTIFSLGAELFKEIFIILRQPIPALTTYFGFGITILEVMFLPLLLRMLAYVIKRQRSSSVVSDE